MFIGGRGAQSRLQDAAGFLKNDFRSLFFRENDYWREDFGAHGNLKSYSKSDFCAYTGTYGLKSVLLELFTKNILKIWKCDEKGPVFVC